MRFRINRSSRAASRRFPRNQARTRRPRARQSTTRIVAQAHRGITCRDGRAATRGSGRVRGGPRRWRRSLSSIRFWFPFASRTLSANGLSTKPAPPLRPKSSSIRRFRWSCRRAVSNGRGCLAPPLAARRLAQRFGLDTPSERPCETLTPWAK